MSTHSAYELPHPDTRPEADVVIYDEACGLCRGVAHQLDRLDCRGRLAFLPLQDPAVSVRYPTLSRAELQKHVHVIDRHGKQRKGAAAVRYLSWRLPALWLLAPLLHVPGSMPLWNWLYRQIARRRHIFDRSQ